MSFGRCSAFLRALLTWFMKGASSAPIDSLCLSPASAAAAAPHAAHLPLLRSLLTRPFRAQALSARTASSPGSSASGLPSSPIRDYFLGGSREASNASPYGTPRSQPEASPNASPLAQLPGAPLRAGLESLKASFEQQLVKLAAELQLRQDQAAQDLELRLERHAAQLDEGSRAERESMAEHIALLERTIE
eukprot:COSAG04_NODE_8069_length_1027_cov_1.219828_1_plen_190_part_01